MREGKRGDALRYAELVGRLEACSVVTRKWSIVHLLSSLSGTGPVDALMVAKPLPQAGGGVEERGEKGRTTLPGHALRVEGRRNVAPGEGEGRGRKGREKGGSEALLLRDVVYALQGIDGRIVRFDQRAQGFVVDPNARVGRGKSGLVLRICELGWLFMRVKAFVVHAANEPSLGLVGQALVAAFQEEMSEYFKLLAVLEGKVESGEEGGSMTLRRLLVWVQDPLVRMKAVATIADAVRGLQGGELVSVVYAYAQHGDPFIAQFVNSVLAAASVPLFSIMGRWMFEGELADPFAEFFVQEAPQAEWASSKKKGEEGEDLWRSRFVMVDRLRPSFISGPVALSVLRIGKTVQFLRSACGVLDWSFDPEIMGEYNQLGYDSAGSELEAVVERASRAANAVLRETMLGKFKLGGVLDVCRRYLLLAQGDFVGYLMELLGEELGRPASQVFRHNLLGTLETALKSTTPIRDPELAECLDVVLLEASPGETGWDVFSLDCVVGAPLTTVLTPDARSKYLQLFSFLWQLKRVDADLSATWRRHANSVSALRALPELDVVVRKCHILRNEMVHFVFNLQYYIMFEIEGAWSALQEDLAAPELDMDGIISAHDVYIDRILERVLLDGHAEELLRIITELFGLISKFRATQDVFYDSAMEEVSRRAAAEARAYERVLAGEWGATDADPDAAPPARYYQLTPAARAQLGAFNVKYDTLIESLLVTLDTQPESALRNLSFRLDFNKHFARKRVVASRAADRYAHTSA